MAELDERMLNERAYISDNKVLLEVQVVKWLGSFPDRKLVVTAEDCSTFARRTLSEKQMKKFHFVADAVCEIEPEPDDAQLAAA